MSSSLRNVMFFILPPHSWEQLLPTLWDQSRRFSRHTDCLAAGTRIDAAAAAAAKSLQSCLTLCDPTDGSPPGSPVPGILQARTLEWVAISFFNA